MDSNSLIKDIGRSYIVSSMLPAGFFVTLGIFIYRASIPESLRTPIFPDQFSFSLLVIYGAVVMWIGFALYSIVNWTVRFFEGYYYPSPIKQLLIYVFKRFHRSKSQKINQIKQANKRQVANWQEIIDENYNHAWADYADLGLTYPIKEEHLMPTKLGNVLRASEQYPERYGLTAGIDIWTRLAPLLPNNLRNELEEKNNNMLFLLNSSLLSFLNGILAIGIVVWYEFRLSEIWAPTISSAYELCAVQNVSSNTMGFSSHQLLLISLFWFLLGYILYLFSIPVSKTISLLVRSSYDLYRFEVLKQLNLPIPKSLGQERKIWARLSDFIVTGGDLGVIPLEFEYALREEYKTTCEGWFSKLRKKMRANLLGA